MTRGAENTGAWEPVYIDPNVLSCSHFLPKLHNGLIPSIE